MQDMDIGGFRFSSSPFPGIQMTVTKGEKEVRRGSNFSAIKIQLASPAAIRAWSSGEVTKPETINYRTFKPERDGLFCERIFGPVKDWECSCGKYKRIRYRGVICDKCGVEVTQAKVRRERLGHIELAVPVCHIWFFKGVPSRIGHLLGMSMKDLERVIYYESYVVIDPGNTALKKKELLTEDEYFEYKSDENNEFVAKMGAPALKDLLGEIDLEELANDLRATIKIETSVQRKKEDLKRLRIVEAFRLSGNRPEWMILDVVPILPPDLRPLVPLEGGRFATSDLNDLYRRVINRNNRLKKLIEIRAPEVILRNEKRMLQEAVDALFDNGRRSRAVRGQGNRLLKSLSDMLKGKQGRFRQNLLGKRVDYSGRSVIVVGPELKMSQCGLPKSMALELFKPFIIKKLEERGFVSTVKSAKKLVERERPEVWDILGEIIEGHPVMLNRAPTLHRLGIQAFQPVLVEGKAIRIHPLVCSAFNADFDGDQMAVHVPLSFEAQIECRMLMLAPNNILKPANGRPSATPSQDIVLGCNYLTRAKPGGRGEGRVFASSDEVVAAYDHGYVSLHAMVKVRVDNQMVDTTVGRVIANEIIPQRVGFVNQELTKGNLEKLVARCYEILPVEETAVFLDRLKDLGFQYATLAGITVGVDDLHIPEAKAKIVDDARSAVEKINKSYKGGKITETERYNKVIDTWTHAMQDVEEATMGSLAKMDDGFNPLYLMAHSGSRGNPEQIRQLAGMRGLMAKPTKKITGGIGEIIETPIINNFKEGLTVLEYFISTHGARKGLADTALKTADAGYLTRRLVDVAQDVIITSEDCGTVRGLDIGALKEGEEVIESLGQRILGRTLVDEVIHPDTGEVIVPVSGTVDYNVARRIDGAGVEQVRMRSVLTCDSKRGVCGKCYGWSLAHNRHVELGEAVGVIAAQSIGEPGTQLTLRTFHIGGVAARIAQQPRVESKVNGIVRYRNLPTVRNPAGQTVVVGHRGQLEIGYEGDDGGWRVRYHHNPPYGAVMHVPDGGPVNEGEVVFEWDAFNEPMLTEKAGHVRFVDIKEKVTVREEVDENSGLRMPVITEDRDKILQPQIEIISKAANRKLATYMLPTGAQLLVEDGQEVKVGEALARRARREVSKTRDITGGLPRVSELFEARKPKDQAVVSEIDGTIEFGKITRGMRKVIVTSVAGDDVREYLIPHGKHLLVQKADTIHAGDKLTDGDINPHDILRIMGIKEVQEYLLNEIQEVYRLQGVSINDKHIEVIVRQMLQKVRIDDPGDTRFLEGDQVDRVLVLEENERVVAEGGQPARFKPQLLGITKASLSTRSFISAASFQETTRILTEAAIQGSVDYLQGLKENVTIGHLIPAGTGLSRYKQLRIVPSAEEDGQFAAQAAAHAAAAAAAASMEEEAGFEGAVETTEAEAG